MLNFFYSENYRLLTNRLYPFQKYPQKRHMNWTMFSYLFSAWKIQA